MSQRPLVYSCSGCSNVAQAANTIAVRLDREGLAEMSCIAGVGAGVPSLVRVARSGRPMLAIDGCPLACCLNALRLREVEPDAYLQLGDLGLRKRQHEDLGDQEAAAVLGFISAIGAYGAAIIPLTFGWSIKHTGSPDAALLGFVGFYVSCIAITWWFYSRKGAEAPC